MGGSVLLPSRIWWAYSKFVFSSKFYKLSGLNHRKHMGTQEDIGREQIPVWPYEPHCVTTRHHGYCTIAFGRPRWPSPCGPLSWECGHTGHNKVATWATMGINICMSILDYHQGCNGCMELHESLAWPHGPQLL